MADIRVAAGLFASAITSFAFSPLLVVSHVLQTRVASDEVSDTLATAQRVLEEKGVEGFYDGVGALVARSAFVLFTKKTLEVTLFRRRHRPSGFESVAVSTLTQVITHPLDTIYTHQVVGPTKRSIVNDIGISGLFSGLLANILSHEIYHLAYIPVQRVLEPWLVTKLFGDMPSNMQVLLVVCGCSLIPMLVSFPFKVVKHRLQIHRTKYSSTIDCFKQTVQQEGTGALWHGALTKSLEHVSQRFVYEIAKDYFLTSWIRQLK